MHLVCEGACGLTGMGPPALAVCAASVRGSGRPAWWASCWVSPASLPNTCELYLGTQLPLRPVLVSSAATQGMDRRPLRSGAGPGLSFPGRAESCLRKGERQPWVCLHTCLEREASHSSCHAARLVHVKCPEPTNTEARSGFVPGGQGGAASGCRFLLAVTACSGTRAWGGGERLHSL